jgi:hypothetical protein
MIQDSHLLELHKKKINGIPLSIIPIADIQKYFKNLIRFNLILHNQRTLRDENVTFVSRLEYEVSYECFEVVPESSNEK